MIDPHLQGVRLPDILIEPSMVPDKGMSAQPRTRLGRGWARISCRDSNALPNLPNLPNQFHKIDLLGLYLLCGATVMQQNTRYVPVVANQAGQVGQVGQLPDLSQFLRAQPGAVRLGRHVEVRQTCTPSGPCVPAVDIDPSYSSWETIERNRIELDSEFSSRIYDDDAATHSIAETATQNVQEGHLRRIFRPQ